MNYEINFEHYRHHFSLPSQIVEEGLKEVDSDYLKVILLIFKNPDKNYSVGLLANLLNLSQDKVEQAIRYWIERGILFSKEEPIQQVYTVSERKQVSANPPADNELKYLLSSMESVLQRPVTSMDVKTVTYIYEYYRLPADVILMAIQYSVEKGKNSMKYIESVCIGWYEQGITTHVQAEEYLQKASRQQDFSNQIKRMFGIQNRKLIPSEEKFIASWYDFFSNRLDMIQLAYERTIQNTGKVAFAYTNKILMNWQEKGYRTLQQVLDHEKPSRRNSSSTVTGGSRSYDLEEFEKYLDQIPKLD